MGGMSAIVSMGKFCAAFNCTDSDKSRGLSFYRFPKCLKRRRQWEAALSRTDPVSGYLWRATEHSRLCRVGAIISVGRTDENSIISASRTDTN